MSAPERYPGTPLNTFQYYIPEFDYYEVDEKTGEKVYVKVAQFEPTDLNKEPRLLFDINTSPWNKIYRTDMLRERQDKKSFPL